MNSQWCEVELKSALMMEAYRDPANCSYPLHPFLSMNMHCTPARVSKKISYKLEIFSDGYTSLKFIQHKIFLIEIYVNEKMIVYINLNNNYSRTKVLNFVD